MKNKKKNTVVTYWVFNKGEGFLEEHATKEAAEASMTMLNDDCKEDAFTVIKGIKLEVVSEPPTVNFYIKE